jgi:hypothetical protein
MRKKIKLKNMERNYIVERGLEKRFNEKKINLKHMEKSYTIKKA